MPKVRQRRPIELECHNCGHEFERRVWHTAHTAGEESSVLTPWKADHFTARCPECRPWDARVRT